MADEDGRVRAFAPNLRTLQHLAAQSQGNKAWLIGLLLTYADLGTTIYIGTLYLGEGNSSNWDREVWLWGHG